MSASLAELQSHVKVVNQMLATLADHWDTSASERKYEELYKLSQEASKVAFAAACLHGAIKREEAAS